MVTGVPTSTRRNRSSISGFVTATQPLVQSFPRPPLPWISISPPTRAGRRQLAAPSREGELRAVLGVREVDEQRPVVVGGQVIHAGHDPVPTLGRRAVPFLALVGNPVEAEFDGVGLHRLAADVHRHQVGVLHDHDCRAPLAPRPLDGLGLPALPPGHGVGVGVPLGQSDRTVADLSGQRRRRPARVSAAVLEVAAALIGQRLAQRASRAGQQTPVGSEVDLRRHGLRVGNGLASLFNLSGGGIGALGVAGAGDVGRASRRAFGGGPRLDDRPGVRNQPGPFLLHPLARERIARGALGRAQFVRRPAHRILGAGGSDGGAGGIRRRLHQRLAARRDPAHGEHGAGEERDADDRGGRLRHLRRSPRSMSPSPHPASIPATSWPPWPSRRLP